MGITLTVCVAALPITGQRAHGQVPQTMSPRDKKRRSMCRALTTTHAICKSTRCLTRWHWWFKGRILLVPARHKPVKTGTSGSHFSVSVLKYVLVTVKGSVWCGHFGGLSIPPVALPVSRFVQQQ